MFRVGKLLFGLAVAGITAATVYNCLDEGSNQSEDEFDDDLQEEEVEEDDE